MGSPFASSSSAPASLQVLATDRQLRNALLPMVTDRNWQNAGLADSWVRRIATIAVTLRIAAEITEHGPSAEKIIGNLDIALDDRDDLHATFHQLMSYGFDAAVNDERDPADSKPLTKAGASKLIDLLGGLEFKNTRSAVEEANVASAKAAVASDRGAAFPSIDVVPAGRYAIETEDGATNELAFYKVDRPTEGRWAGYVFVKLMISDGEQRMSFAASKAIMAKIAEAGAEAASARYGHEIGECGVCGRTLTNDDSRARGIGPVCAQKNGW